MITSLAISQIHHHINTELIHLLIFLSIDYVQNIVVCNLGKHKFVKDEKIVLTI